MTKSELERLEKLCNEATPGPWKKEEVAYAHGRMNYRGQNFEADCEFIAASRTALPQLISNVRSLQSRLEVAERALEYISSDFFLISNKEDANIATIEEMQKRHDFAKQALQQIRERKE